MRYLWGRNFAAESVTPEYMAGLGLLADSGLTLEINCEQQKLPPEDSWKYTGSVREAKRKCRFMTVRARRYNYNSVVEG